MACHALELFWHLVAALLKCLVLCGLPPQGNLSLRLWEGMDCG
jgi:hypothetical protein